MPLTCSRPPGRCAIDTTYVTECSAKAGQWLQKARAKAAKP